MYPREYFDNFWRPGLKNEVFVVMSFAAEFTPVWEHAIKPAIEIDTPGQMVAHRADITRLSGSILSQIFDGVAHACLIFAEVSVCESGRWAGQRNGNAMYELGLAQALRQAEELIVVRSDNEDLNFDISVLRAHHYERHNRASARQMFAELISDSLQQIDATKGLLVERAVASLDVDSIRLMMTHGLATGFSHPVERTMRDTMTGIAEGVRPAIDRLLSLGIIRCVIAPPRFDLEYRWTDFGRAVLRRIGADRPGAKVPRLAT
jgi:hypothetical protein